MPLLPLEMIPHVAQHFAEPCRIESGRYQLPVLAGASTTLA
jgi:hypothetical protein